MLPLPLRFLVATIAPAMTAHLARKVEYLLEEVRVLQEAHTLVRAAGMERSRPSSSLK